MRLIVFLLTMFAPTVAVAQTAAQTTQIISAWESWADTYGVKTAITIGHNGTILASHNKGRDPSTPYPLASLSKAITAVCLKRVLDEKGVSFNATLGELQSEFDKVNIAIPASFAERTLASVVSMTSGMNPDRTQSRINGSFRYGDTRNISFSKRALAASGLKGTAGDFFYNNGSYALLGALLEALTGTDNVSACRDRTFPKGHQSSAGFSSDWIALAGFGGWQASTDDYTAFIMDAFGPDGDIASDLFNLPNYGDERGWFYGLGTHFRVRQPQNVYWHAGALCRAKVGSYFAYYPNGYAVTVTYNACGIGEIFQELDGVLFKAANE